jgi:hypothetical protein
MEIGGIFMDKQDILEKRFEVLLDVIIGNKWTHIPKLEKYRPNNEKYITRESLIPIIDHLSITKFYE